MSSEAPAAKDGDGESGSEYDSSEEDEENQTVCVSQRVKRPSKRQKTTKGNNKGRQWVLKHKEKQRRKGCAVPPDSKYTCRKRKDRF